MKVKRKACDDLPEISPAVAASWQALHAGKATDHQQQLAVSWLLWYAADRGGFHYHPDDRDTAFALGRKFVGDQVVGMIEMNISKLGGVGDA